MACSTDIHVVIKSFLSSYYKFFFVLPSMIVLHILESVGWTPLHSAAASGSTDVLNILIATPGCDINVEVMYANLVLVSLLGVKKLFDQFHAQVLHQCS